MLLILKSLFLYNPYCGLAFAVDYGLLKMLIKNYYWELFHTCSSRKNNYMYATLKNESTVKSYVRNTMSGICPSAVVVPLKLASSTSNLNRIPSQMTSRMPSVPPKVGGPLSRTLIMYG